MNTVINNPNSSGESSGMGMVVGVILAIVLIVLFFVYALPAIRGGENNNDAGLNLDINLPTGNEGGAPAN